MKPLLRKSLLITLANIVLGFFISVTAFSLSSSANFSIPIDASIRLTWYDIFYNNIKFIFLYALPYIGPFLYCISFVYIYIIIGVTVSSTGINYAISKLLHLPLEVYALSLPLLLFRFRGRYNKSTYLGIYMLLTVLMLIASFIESSL